MARLRFQLGVQSSFYFFLKCSGIVVKEEGIGRAMGRGRLGRGIGL